MKTKTMTMFLLLLIALSAVGFAYSYWSDEVQIEGTVHMGELIVGILNNTVICEEQPEHLDKDVANITCELSDFETSVHHTPQQTVGKLLNVTINNAYPQYGVWINFTLKNAGTIPAHINVTVTGWNCTDDPLNYTNDDLCEWNGSAWIPVMNFRMRKWNATANAWVNLTTCEQLEPCTDYLVYIKIHFKQEAKECCTYHFKIKIDAIQWNKWP